MDVRVYKSKAGFRRKFNTMLPSVGCIQNVRFSTDIAPLIPIKLLIYISEQIISDLISTYPVL